MTDTLVALDQAIQRHIAEINNGAVTEAWILVAHSQQLDDADPVSGYRIVTSDTQSYHVDLGLLDVGQLIAKASWDDALEDTDE